MSFEDNPTWSFSQPALTDNRIQKEIGDMVNYIRNLNIRLKLYVLIGVALLGLLIIGGMSFILMGRLNSVASDI